MNYLLEVLQKSPSELEPGQKWLLVLVILCAVVIAACSARRLVHSERRLQAVDSELSRLTKGGCAPQG